MTTGRKPRLTDRKAAKRLKNAKKRRLRASQITDSVREDIKLHAREGFEKHNPPQEVCGFIATDGNKQQAFRSPNRSHEPHHAFRTCAKAWRRIEDKGLEIIAIYHSHVNEPPVPSRSMIFMAIAFFTSWMEGRIDRQTIHSWNPRLLDNGKGLFRGKKGNRAAGF